MGLTASGLGGKRWFPQITISSLETDLFVFSSTINRSLFLLLLAFIFVFPLRSGLVGFQEAEVQETWEERVQSHDSSKPAHSSLSHCGCKCVHTVSTHAGTGTVIRGFAENKCCWKLLSSFAALGLLWGGRQEGTGESGGEEETVRVSVLAHAVMW